MKIKIIIALVAIAALCTLAFFIVANGTCKKSRLTKEDVTIIGSWKVDSISYSKDTMNLNIVAFALWDSNTIFTFKPDSILQVATKNDTTTQEYFIKKDTLYTFVDSTKNTDVIKFVGDSLVTIATNNKVNLVLKRLLEKSNL